ncbi:MAG: hypothetical protein RBR86_06780 [Pseudobdellovibrionaceae bacterium]|jgi:hypothetical protein|nr:hypothetical protein [Pseudobdellovibrionaceae bacterium]
MTSFSPSTAQRGSSLVIILIAVALFAALTYAISKSSNSGKNLSQEQTRLFASEIIDSGNRFSETISRMKLAGVMEADISFEYNGNYVNGACTIDDCMVFNFNGGGLEWDTAPTGSTSGDDWIFTSGISIDGIGTTDNDLVAILPRVNESVCHRINVLIDIETEADATPVSASGINADGFTGSYTSGAPTTISSAKTIAKRSGCVLVASMASDMLATSPVSQPRVYYQVLIAR